MKDTMTTRTNLVAILFMLTAASLVVLAVGTLTGTTTQAKTEAESSSTSCVNDQPCKTTMVNSNTPDSPNVDHNSIHASTPCLKDQPCKTTERNPAGSLLHDEFADNED
jgi:hypothetical protein